MRGIQAYNSGSLPYNSGFLCVLSATGPELVFAGQSLSQISVPFGGGDCVFYTFVCIIWRIVRHLADERLIYWELCGGFGFFKQTGINSGEFEDSHILQKSI